MFKFRIMNQDTCEVTTVDTIEEIFKFFKLDINDWHYWLEHLEAPIINNSNPEELTINTLIHYMETENVHAWIFVNKKG